MSEQWRAVQSGYTSLMHIYDEHGDTVAIGIRPEDAEQIVADHNDVAGQLVDLQTHWQQALNNRTDEALAVTNAQAERVVALEAEVARLRDAVCGLRLVRMADDGQLCWCLTEHAHRKYGCEQARAAVAAALVALKRAGVPS